jgi:YtcA family
LLLETAARGRISWGVMARSFKPYANASSALLLACPLIGCSRSEAPSFEIVGAYFPAWMLCALFGIIAAAGARAAFVAGGLSNVLPYQLFVCTSIGLIFAFSLWLIQFG